MANTYRAVSDRGIALHGTDPFEADLSSVDERDEIAGGHLVIVPRSYRVLSNNYSPGKQGDLVDLALLVENEAALIAGGHIERADKPAATKKAAAATTEKKG